MISAKRRHQYALSLCHTQLFHSHLITSSPRWKRFGFPESKSLSPFLSLSFGFFWNSVNSKFSLILDDSLLLGSGGSLDCTCWNPWSEACRKWEELGVEGRFWGISLYWTLSALKILTIQHRSLVWRIHSFGVNSYRIQKTHCLQHLQQQQEQQIHIIKITMFITIVPQVVVLC